MKKKNVRKVSKKTSKKITRQKSDNRWLLIAVGVVIAIIFVLAATAMINKGKIRVGEYQNTESVMYLE